MQGEVIRRIIYDMDPEQYEKRTRHGYIKAKRYLVSPRTLAYFLHFGVVRNLMPTEDPDEPDWRACYNPLRQKVMQYKERTKT
jgi:hypothetical protein